MSSKPFISQNTNILNQTKYNSVPGKIGAEAVLLTQSATRRIIDQQSLTISNNSQQQPLYCNCVPTTSTLTPPSNNVLTGQREYFPGGVSYTFNQNSLNYQGNQASNNIYGLNPTPPYNQLQSQPLTLEQQIALKQLEKTGLELTLMQERLKQNPFRLSFHQDVKTSTSDLLVTGSQIPISQGMPDLKSGYSEYLKHNLQVSSTQKTQNEDPTKLYTSKKKLILSKTPDLQKQETSLTKKDFESDNNCPDYDDEDDDDDDEDDDDEDDDDSTSSKETSDHTGDTDSDKTKQNKKTKKSTKKTKKEKNKKSPAVNNHCDSDNSDSESNNNRKTKAKRKKTTDTKKKVKKRTRTDSEGSIIYNKKRKRCNSDKRRVRKNKSTSICNCGVYKKST